MATFVEINKLFTRLRNPMPRMPNKSKNYNNNSLN